MLALRISYQYVVPSGALRTKSMKLVVLARAFLHFLFPVSINHPAEEAYVFVLSEYSIVATKTTYYLLGERCVTVVNASAPLYLLVEYHLILIVYPRITVHGS